MVKIGLYINAALENLEYIETCGEDFRWYLKIRCENCGEVSSSWQYITLEECLETKGGRGVANLVEKCKLCSRENHMIIIKESISKYTADDDRKDKCLVIFDCRGIEPIEFDLRQGWVAKAANSKTIFDEVDLVEKEWYDYDGLAEESVSITEIKVHFKKVK